MTALFLQKAKEPTRLGALFLEAAAAQGEAATIIDASRGPLAVLELRRILLNRPKVAFVEVGPSTAIFPALLTTARVPYALSFDHRPLGDRAPASFEILKAGLRLAAARATAVIAESPIIAAETAELLDLPEVLSFADTIDLSYWPLASKRDAQGALGLVPEGRYLGLAADLRAPHRLDLLATVHRRLAGTGLLVAGTGPDEALLGAMAAATRPSSPVIHLGDRAAERELAIGLAADVIVGLDPRGPSGVNFGAVALGRRQVLLDSPGAEQLAPYYPDARTIFTAEPHPEALALAITSAFEEEERAGPLPPLAIDRARRAIDAATLPSRVWKVVCASSS